MYMILLDLINQIQISKGLVFSEQQNLQKKPNSHQKTKLTNNLHISQKLNQINTSMTKRYTKKHIYQLAVSFLPLAISLISKIQYKKYIEDTLSLAKYPFRSFEDILTISVLLAGTKFIEHSLLSFSEYIQRSKGNELVIEYQQKIIQKSMKTNLDFNKKYSLSSISSLINNESTKLVEYFYQLCNICLIPLQLAFSMEMIKEKTGDFWMIVLALIIVLSYLTFYFSKKQLAVSAILKKISEERYRIIQNVNYSIKYIKGTNSEEFYLNKINKIREKEIEQIELQNYYGQWNAVLKKFAQPIIIATILFYYVIYDDQIIDMNSIYQIEQSFWIVRQCLNQLPILLCQYLDSLQNIKRIEDFLDIEEILPLDKRALPSASQNQSFEDNSRLLVNNQSNNLLPKKISLNLSDISKNNIIVLKGPTACGKSLFLKSLLGEYNKSQIISDRNIAYVGQDNWMMNKSIKENIILDNEYNEEYFDLVVSCFDLDKDIKDFNQIISQRSDNLSGGQKQRINIARAFYKNSKSLILLDDSFSALDKKVMKNCIQNIIKYFKQDRIIIISINENQFIERHADILVKLKQDGTLDAIEQNQSPKSEANNNSILSSNNSLQSSFDLASTLDDSFEVISKSKLTQLKLQKRSIKYDDKEGDLEKFIQIRRRNSIQQCKFRQTFDLFQQYTKEDNQGRKYLMLATLSVLTYSILDLAQTQVMKYWDSKLFSQNTYIYTLIIILLLDNAGQCFRKYFIDVLCLVSSKKIHQEITDKTLNSHYQLYINQTVTPSKIQDILSIQISNLDHKLNLQIPAFYFYFFGIIINILLSLMGTKEPSIFIAMCTYLYFGYKIAQNNVEDLKQIQKKLKELSGPLINYSNQCLQGLCYIRAYGIQQFILNEYIHLQENQQLWRDIQIKKKFYHDLFISSFGFMFNLFSFFFTLQSDDPLSIGPKITFAINIDIYIILLVKSINEIQDSMQSYQKCTDFLKEIKSFNDLTNLKKEKQQVKVQNPTESKVEIKGGLKFVNFTAEYVQQQKALKNLNISISPGEKVCIVGRTGSGKSTILLSILDLLNHTSGKVLFDDMELAGGQIRDNISIIMQESIVFEGTVKQNIDPLDKYTNEELFELIKKLELDDILTMNHLSLDIHLEESGKNLSQGEKQVISLVRALIQQRKIILFDEANSSIDEKNENILQNFLFKTKSTVIFIAHKITNVMNFDRIIFLNQGEILEQGSPKELLDNSQSHFYSLYHHL
ncbi:hypothetical protein ABPG72_021875 [Tetrahymena utriculariae]